jgi:hypothetical protein
MKKNYAAIIYTSAVLLTSSMLSCGKSSPDPAPVTPDVCAGKNIVIAFTVMPSAGCASDGSIIASATGSTGFTYKLNSGASYQSSGTFAGLAPGSYTIFARDAAGCEKSQTAVIGGGTSGTMFTQVRSLITARCNSCHNNSVQNGGMNFAIDCNIVANKTRIKVRAVDQGTMPPTGPLSQSEKDIITNWINAGGRLTD